jgi:hypothetical protein
MVILARGDTPVMRWPLAWLRDPGDSRGPGGAARPDLALIDLLSRMHLGARRVGWSIRLADVCVELAELLELVGLSDVLLGVAGLCRQVGRESEGGEEVGVDEVVMPGDAVP